MDTYTESSGSSFGTGGSASRLVLPLVVLAVVVAGGAYAGLLGTWLAALADVLQVGAQVAGATIR